MVKPYYGETNVLIHDPQSSTSKYLDINTHDIVSAPPWQATPSQQNYMTTEQTVRVPIPAFCKALGKACYMRPSNFSVRARLCRAPRSTRDHALPHYGNCRLQILDTPLDLLPRTNKYKCSVYKTVGIQYKLLESKALVERRLESINEPVML